MNIHSEETVLKVREKRKQEGLSVDRLARMFNVPSGTVSRWVRDIDNGGSMFQRSRALNLQSKSRYLDSLETTRIDGNNARVLAALLYWCEGAKYPSSNFIAFCNSDEKLTKTFITLIRRGFELDESKFRVCLQLHTTHNVKEMTKYWSELLDIPESKFHKPTITKPRSNFKKRLNYKGTCTIKYFDVRLLLGVIGLYEAFTGRVAERSKAISC